jgi:ATP-dependent helicase/DNAse subunit B
MILLTGLPGADLIGPVVDRFREDPDSILIVPTATLGEHLRNHLARGGGVVRPSRVLTFAKFLQNTTPDLHPLSSSMLAWSIRHALEHRAWPTLRAVQDYPGFRRALKSSIEELHATGASPSTLRDLTIGDPFLSDVADVMQLVEADAARQGLSTRPELLAEARRRVVDARLPSTVYFAGFYSFTGGELDVLEAIAERAEVVLSLPKWRGSRPVFERLTRREPEIVEVAPARVASRRELMKCSSQESEAEEIAWHILEEHRQGRPFREMGIVVRSRVPYAPLLGEVLERFGIPVRLYFGPPARTHASLAMLRGILQALLERWDSTILIPALRAEGSPLAQDDAFEVRALRGLPTVGLDAVRAHAGERHPEFFDRLLALESWLNSPAAPSVWAQRVGSLTSFYEAPVLEAPSRGDALKWRERGAALRLWQELSEKVAHVFEPDRPISLLEFWGAFVAELEEAELRVPDHRRDVVHVLDAFEARQWRLPVIFVCGLYERHFPHYSWQDPILNDGVRLALTQQGYPLPTSADRQADEGFLFDLLARIATERLVGSLPKLDASGNERLPSFFLERLTWSELSSPSGLFVEPRMEPPKPFDPWMIANKERIAARLTALSVSGINKFLNCPFQLFAQEVLKLREFPKAPAERFAWGLQGSLAHAVLELVHREQLPLDEAIVQAFDKLAAENALPLSYHTEGIRLEVLQYVDRFLRSNRLPPGGNSVYEEKIPLTIDGVELRSRIDRIDFDGLARATVIDYKYKAPARLKEEFEAQEKGEGVQAGLYLLAAEQRFNLNGFLYAGLKKTINFYGWTVSPPPVEGVSHVTSDELARLMTTARDKASSVIAQIREGTIRPAPKDTDLCKRCEAAPVCRVREAPLFAKQQLVALGGGL